MGQQSLGDNKRRLVSSNGPPLKHPDYMNFSGFCYRFFSHNYKKKHEVVTNM